MYTYFTKLRSDLNSYFFATGGLVIFSRFTSNHFILKGAGGSIFERGIQSKGPAKKKKTIRLAASRMQRLGIPKADFTPPNCFFAGLSLSENNFWDSKNLHFVHVLLNSISHYKTAL